MKYAAHKKIIDFERWINDNHIYKNKVVEDIPNDYIMIFIDYLINSNDVQIPLYILKKRIYIMLLIPYKLLSNRTFQEIDKIYKFIKLANITIHDMTLLLNKCNLDKLTLYNVNDVLKYIKNYDDLISGKTKIEWGPGNHGESDKNVLMHFIKHVITDKTEGELIKNILVNTNLSSNNNDNTNDNNNTNNNTHDNDYYTMYQLYKNYPIMNFTKMEKITIHTDGKHTYMSGIVQNMFIVGRYTNDVFGISSCYYLFSGDKIGRHNTKCVDL